MENGELFDRLYKRLKDKGNERRIIGILGLVGSGKSHFTDEFVQFLKRKGIDALHLNMDIYNSSTRAERNRIVEALRKNYDPNWPRKAYPQDETLIKDHLTNIREGKNFLTHNLCDPSTKELSLSMKFLFEKNKIKIKIGNEEHEYNSSRLWILCDGVKLLKYREHFDCTIFIKSSPEIRFNRLLERNKMLASPANIRWDLFDDVERNLIEEYLLDEKNTDIVVDNNDFNNRKIIKI